MKQIVNEIPIHYKEIGNGKPIVIIHGLYTDHNVMKTSLEPIFKNITLYKRIYIDLPGMGETPSHPSIKNADDMLQTILKFIDIVVGDKNFILIGHCYGGYLSLGMIYKIKDKIDGLFLICPCVIADGSKRNLKQKEFLIIDDEFLNIDACVNLENYFEMNILATKSGWNFHKKNVLTGVSKANLKFLNSYKNNGYKFSFEDSFKYMLYDNPCTILTGKQDYVVGYNDCFKFLDNFKQCTFMALEMAGHYLQFDQEEIFNLSLMLWLKSLSQESTDHLQWNA